MHVEVQSCLETDKIAIIRYLDLIRLIFVYSSNILFCMKVVLRWVKQNSFLFHKLFYVFILLAQSILQWYYCFAVNYKFMHVLELRCFPSGMKGKTLYSVRKKADVRKKAETSKKMFNFKGNIVFKFHQHGWDRK